MPTTPSFDRFLTRVHRRAIAWRLAESAAIGLTIGAIAALALGSVARLHRTPASPWIMLAAVGSSVVGVAIGWSRRPTRLAAAAMADDQLKLADLLSTALLSRDGDFAAVVRSLADQAVARHSPNEILLRRLPGRAWGGLALAWAGTGTLLLLINPASSPHTAMAANAERSPQALRLSDQSVARTLAIGRQEASSDDFSHMGQTSMPAAPRSAASAASAALSSADPRHASTDSHAGRGAGQATSDSHPSDAAAAPAPRHSPDRFAASPSTDRMARPSLPAGNAAADHAASGAEPVARDATGQVASPPNGTTANAGSASGGFTDPPPALPNSAVFSSAPNGRVPAQYDDLVRDYFSAPTASVNSSR